MKFPGLNVHRGTGGHYVADVLGRLGMRHLISLPGSQVLPVWDGLGDDDVEVVVPRTERKAAFLAEGYARAGTGPAVLMCTLGPGVANELVGIASCAESGAPVLAMAPYHPPGKRPRMREVFQGLRHPEFFAGIPKRHHVIDEDTGEALTSTIEAAHRETLADPSGPVRVDVSFPILFRRRFRRHVPLEAPSAADPAPDGFLVAETQEDPADSSDGPDASDLSLERLSPGIGEAGFALPFALGLALARPDRPVAVSTASPYLHKNLDVFELARMHGIGVEILRGPDAEDLQALGGVGGADVRDDVNRPVDVLRDRMRDGSGGLLIHCHERVDVHAV